MKYYEFFDKLCIIMVEYRKSEGRDLVTIEELKKYLNKRLVKKSNKLKSLRGIM